MNSLWFALAVGFKYKLNINININCLNLTVVVAFIQLFSTANLSSDFSKEKRDCEEKCGYVKDILLWKQYLENYWIHHSKMAIIYSQKKKKNSSSNSQLEGCRDI